MPAAVWVCTTHMMSGRAMWMAEWMQNPAAFTLRGDMPAWCASSMMLPSRSIFTRSEARISSNSTPYWLIRKWCSGPGMRAERWV